MIYLVSMPGGTEWIIIAALFLFGIILIPTIFYLLTLQNTLKEVSPENRKMPPSNVWLLLIPLFSTVYYFFVVGYIADSLKAEFAKRNIASTEDRPGYSLGLTICILGCVGWIPYIGTLASLVYLVCWIIFWVKIAGYKNLLEQNRHMMMEQGEKSVFQTTTQE